MAEIPAAAVAAAAQAIASGNVTSDSAAVHAAARAALTAAYPHIIDAQLLDDADFERRLRAVMRRNPQLLENWIRKRERIHGGRWLR